MYIVPDDFKASFAVKNTDGLYNLYEINESTSQLTAQFASKMVLTLKFNSGIQYDFYEDFENYTFDKTKWHIKSGVSVAYPVIESDNTKYLKHTTGPSTTGGYMTFDEVDTTAKTVTITAEVKFTEPAGSGKGNSQFAISNTSPSFGGNNINWGIIASGSRADGHIIGLEYNGGDKFFVNGETADSAFIGDWIHLEAEADFSKKIVKVVLTNDAGKRAEFDTAFYSSSLESNIGSMYLRSAGTDGSVSVDNLTVQITGDAGPVEPNIESPINHKTIYAFGDSIVYGHNEANKSFMRLIANDYATELKMMAKNGATVMESKNQILSQIEAAPAEAPDFIVFDGYTNDAYGSKKTDPFNADGTNRDVTQCYGEITPENTTEFDTSTFCGAFEQIIYTIRQKWQTGKIVFITIHKSGARNMEIQTKLHELTTAICEKWDVTVVDMFKDSELDTTDEEQMKKYMIGAKGSHPNETACKEFYIPAVVKELERLCGGEAAQTEKPTAELALASLLREKRQVMAEDNTIKPNKKNIFKFNVGI